MGDRGQYREKPKAITQSMPHLNITLNLLFFQDRTIMVSPQAQNQKNVQQQLRGSETEHLDL